MKRFSISALSLVLLAILLVGSRYARGEDQPGTAGTISVTVLDKDGKPVEGATVRVTAPKQVATREPKLADEQKPAEKPKAIPVAEARTDRDGKATLEKIPAGSFNLAANLKGVGTARQKISVKAGETLSVELKLMPRAVTK